MDPKLAQLEKRVAELEAFAREQMAESIALGTMLRAVGATVDARQLAAAVDALLPPWETPPGGSAEAKVPEAIRLLVVPRVRAWRETLES